jgi:D-alanyl-D-alanine carboxypeptidase/D-alanyl-D-alanine-endopeptidase (penicillin-binding protein 4)
MQSQKITFRGWCGRAVVLVLAAAWFAPQAASDVPTAGGEAWVRSLDRTLSGNGLRGAEVSALVVRQRDGVVLYARTPDRLMIPASNAKLLTALVVLDAFGPSHRFTTQLLSDAQPGPKGEVGQLYLRGGGDPTITSEDWWRLAAELRDAGLRRVRGDLLLDDTSFDRVRWHPTVEGISSRAYHAPVGALNANYGSFAVTVRPGAKVGSPVLVTVNPPVWYLEISNHGTTLAKRARRSLVVDRVAGEDRETVTIRGGVRVGDPPKTYYRSVVHPDRYAGAVLKMQLAAVGIEVAGRVRAGVVPENAYALHSFEGRTVGEIVRLFMKFSNNGIAESMVKNLATLSNDGFGTWSAGMPELRRRLIASGVPAAGFKLVDGSGLSYHDRVSPRALVAALRVALDSFRFGPEFVASLPIAARDGTLEDRAAGARDWARAKTGLLNGVTGLSGYAGVASSNPQAPRERVVFSVLANGCKHGDSAAMDAIDDFVTLLTEGRAP